MRKLSMILALALSMLALSASLNAGFPAPECYPNCPQVSATSLMR
jgi:hypothetical protein